MNKNNIAIGIFLICMISLLIGLITPQNKNIQPTNKQNQVLHQIDITGDRIALLNIEGAISSDATLSTWSNEFSLDGFLNSIEKAQKDDKVKAVIIRINSPGGTVAASQDIFDAITRLKATKPVIASLADVAASGGYYAASAADRIIAQKGTMTGSIGVIFNFVDVENLANKIGITPHIIKSGKFKDSGSMYRKMTTEEEQLFKNSVNNAYSQFITAIEIGRINRTDNYDVPKRDLSIKTLHTYADGRVFLGEEAYKLGFIDALGSQYDAQIIASKMAKSKSLLPIVAYNKNSGIKNFLMGIENKLSIKKALPFSFIHNSIPLALWE